MTVKELREALETCNDDAQVLIRTRDDGSVGLPINNDQIFENTDWNLVIIDPTLTETEVNDEVN